MKFYSNGKLLITGEYFVLNGALSLALPTVYGQYLEINKNDSNIINWTSYNYDKEIWFKCEIDKDNLIIEGQIIDLKNSKIYLAMVDEGKIIDSANVIDGKFTLKTYINEPIEMSLILEEKHSGEKFNFFSEVISAGAVNAGEMM